MFALLFPVLLPCVMPRKKPTNAALPLPGSGRVSQGEFRLALESAGAPLLAKEVSGIQLGDDARFLKLYRSMT